MKRRLTPLDVALPEIREWLYRKLAEVEKQKAYEQKLAQ